VKKREISQLRHERERRGWSRNYVAEQVEVDVVTVGRWERGERLPHPVYRQKLCTLFEMNAQSLGLFTEPSLNLDEKKEVSDKPPDVLDPSEELSFDSIQTATNLPEQIPVEKKKLFPVSLPAVYTRRSVLIGLGGITALAGASFLFASRSRALRSTGPVHIVADKPFQHFLDTTVNWINRVSWSPDERYIAGATGTDQVTIWDRENGELVRYFQTPNQWVNDVAWSKTNWIAMCSAGTTAGTLAIWRPTANNATRTFPRPYALRSSAWSPDGNYLAFSGHSTIVEIWKPFVPHQVSRYVYTALGTQGGFSRVRWSAKGDLLMCAADDGTVHVCDALTGQKRTIYRNHQGRVIDVAWSPDSQYVASAGADKTVQVWEALSGRTVYVYRGHTDEVEGVDWSLQGNYIVSGGMDQTAHVWEAFTGKVVISYEKLNSVVETTLWSGDGTMVVLGMETEGIEVWKVS
jgi:transcriptional regulator with XRE-family HTH domain